MEGALGHEGSIASSGAGALASILGNSKGTACVSVGDTGDGGVSMRDVIGNIRYALRQFRSSPVFTVAAVLTLALGIGGTTAIFTLIDAVMLRSLPVSDPGRLYRVGEGDDCCVQGSPQDSWGMFSFDLYKRLKTETPEFAEVAAFQAGRGRLGVRRQGVDSIDRPLLSEHVTGNYFSTLGVRAFGGRM